jgi:hypothetical protein
MSDDFGPIIPVVSPFLERIAREERLSGEAPPRKQRYSKPKAAKKDSDSTPSDDTKKTDDSKSLPHIDLRI